MTRHFNLSFLIFLLASLLGGCGGSSESVTSRMSEIYTPQYAEGYSIFGENEMTSSLIRVRLSGDENGEVVRELFIRRDEETVPHGYKGPVLEGEATRIICLSAPQTAMLHLVDATDRIVGISDLDKITAPDIRSRRAEIINLGDTDRIDIQQIVSLKPDLVLLDAGEGVNPIEKRLDKLSIPYLYIGDKSEESPLGKAEWMMAVAETVGSRRDAEEVFRQIPEKYNSLRQRVAKAGGKRPKVLFNIPVGGHWTLPAKGSYFSILLDDAGGDCLYGSSNHSDETSISMDMALSLAAGADKWLNLGPEIHTPADLREALPKFANLPVVGWAELYNNTERINAGGGNDFYESGTVNPDLVLRDLIKIMYPSLVPEPFTYYRRLMFHSTDEEDNPEFSDLSDIPDLP